MSLARIKSWIAGEALAAADLNAEFNNLLTNARSLISPLTGSIDMDGFEVIMDADADTSLTADTDDRIDVRLGGVDLFHFDGTTASCVNGMDFVGVATGGRPRFVAIGGDTNVGVGFRPKGTGAGANVVLEDGNGNEVLIADIATTSAVNEFTVTNAATGMPPSLRATGGDANIGIAIAPKGSAGVYINDTSNANNTAGLTINQAASDDEILSMKSSDIAHGMTSIAETDTYGVLAKATATGGGLNMFGYTEDTVAFQVNARVTLDDTSKGNASLGTMHVVGQKKSGTTVGAMAANANLLTVATDTTTRFILDSDGDSHQDVGTSWTNYHGHDDHELLSVLSAHVSRRDDPIRGQFAEFLTQNREVLERAKLVTFNEDGHHFVNMSKLAMLHTGAILQVGDRLTKVEKLLEAVQSLLGLQECLPSK